MPNPLGRQSLVQIELAGKLPHEQPDYLTSHEWNLLGLHVTDGATIKALADLDGTPYNKMMMAIQRIGALVARNLELPDSALAALPIDAPTDRTRKVKPKAEPATLGHSGRQARAVMSVTLYSKYEDMENGCVLVIRDSQGRELEIDGLPARAAADFEVGKTYNLYLG